MHHFAKKYTLTEQHWKGFRNKTHFYEFRFSPTQWTLSRRKIIQKSEVEWEYMRVLFVLLRSRMSESEHHCSAQVTSQTTSLIPIIWHFSISLMLRFYMFNILTTFAFVSFVSKEDLFVCLCRASVKKDQVSLHLNHMKLKRKWIWRTKMTSNNDSKYLLDFIWLSWW